MLHSRHMADGFLHELLQIERGQPARQQDGAAFMFD
jgi:hypothetical protein